MAGQWFISLSISSLSVHQDETGGCCGGFSQCVVPSEPNETRQCRIEFGEKTNRKLKGNGFQFGGEVSATDTGRATTKGNQSIKENKKKTQWKMALDKATASEEMCLDFLVEPVRRTR